MERAIELEILSSLVGNQSEEFWEFRDRLDEFQFEYEPAKLIFRLLRTHWKDGTDAPSPGFMRTYLRNLKDRIGPDMYDLSVKTVEEIYHADKDTKQARDFIAEFIAANEMKYFAEEIGSLEMGSYRSYIAGVQDRLDRIAQLERAKVQHPGLDPFSHEFLKNPSRKIRENYGGIPIGTGFERFDTFIDPLYPGEFGLFIAPTGKGKSVWLTNLAWNAAYNYRIRVVYFALDNLAAEFAERFHTRATGIDVKFARKHYDDDVVDKKVADKFYAKTGGEALRVHIRDFPRNTISVRDIRKYLRSMRRQWVREDRKAGLPEDQWGKVGLLLVDYGDLMILDKPTGQDWIDRERNYNNLSALGSDERCPVWSVSQTNTDAVRKGGGNVKEWHAAGGMSKLSPVRIGLSLLQSPQEYLQGVFNMYCWKATRSQSGIVFPMKIKYNKQLILEQKDMEPYALAGGHLRGNFDPESDSEFKEEARIDTDIFGNVEEFYKKEG